MNTTYDISNLDFVNKEDGLKRVQNNKELYNKLLTHFSENTYTEDLEAALKQDDTENLHTEVHKIKGVAANLSLDKLYEASLHYEGLLLSDKVTKADGQDFINVLKKTITHIKHYILK